MSFGIIQKSNDLIKSFLAQSCKYGIVLKRTDTKVLSCKNELILGQILSNLVFVYIQVMFSWFSIKWWFEIPAFSISPYRILLNLADFTDCVSLKIKETLGPFGDTTPPYDTYAPPESDFVALVATHKRVIPLSAIIRRCPSARGKFEYNRRRGGPGVPRGALLIILSNAKPHGEAA